MNRILFVLSALSGLSGAAMLILSMSTECVDLLNAGLIALLISGLLLIVTVLSGHMGYGRQT
jgi:hypothetical protein